MSEQDEDSIVKTVRMLTAALDAYDDREPWEMVRAMRQWFDISDSLAATLIVFAKKVRK